MDWDANDRDRAGREPVHIDIRHAPPMCPVQTGIHWKVIHVKRSGSAGTDKKFGNLKGGGAGIFKGDIQGDGVGLFLVRAHGDSETLGDLEAAGLLAGEGGFAFGRIGRHLESA